MAAVVPPLKGYMMIVNPKHVMAPYWPKNPHLMYYFYNSINNQGKYYNSSTGNRRVAFITTPTIYFSNNTLSNYVQRIARRPGNISLSPHEKTVIRNHLIRLTKGSSANLKLNRAAAVIRHALNARERKARNRNNNNNQNQGHNTALKYYRILNKAVENRPRNIEVHQLRSMIPSIRVRNNITQAIKNLSNSLNVRARTLNEEEELRRDRAIKTQRVMMLIGTGGRVRGGAGRGAGRGNGGAGRGNGGRGAGRGPTLTSRQNILSLAIAAAQTQNRRQNSVASPVRRSPPRTHSRRTGGANELANEFRVSRR